MWRNEVIKDLRRMAALQFFFVWLIGEAAWLIGDDLSDYLWRFLAAVVFSTVLRYWAMSRYRRRAASSTAPGSEADSAA